MTPLMGAWQQILGAWQQVLSGTDPVAAAAAMAAPPMAPPPPMVPAVHPHHHHQAHGGGGIQPRAWLAPYPDPTLASRQGLPMNTGGQKVPYNSTAIITSRPQRVAFRPERIFVSPPIGGTAGLGSAGWFINDITIGNRSQLVQAGGLPGDMFQNTSIDSFVTFETAQTSMDVVISTTLIDTAFMSLATVNPGAVFYGGIIGTAAI